jgi:hypothetical protein
LISYIYPPHFRDNMAELWGLPEIRHWWLPFDEGFPTIIHNIRTFMKDRSPHPKFLAVSEDIGSVKGVASDLSVNEDDRGAQEYLNEHLPEAE